MKFYLNAICYTPTQARSFIKQKSGEIQESQMMGLIRRKIENLVHETPEDEKVKSKKWMYFIKYELDMVAQNLPVHLLFFQ